MDPQREYEALYREALRLKTEGRADQAQAVENKAARLFETLQNRAQQNPDDPQTATDLLFLADRRWAVIGDHPDVQALLERALAIRQDHAGLEGLAVAEPVARLADFHGLAGRWGQADPLYRRAISILERGGAAGAEAWAKCQGGLAQTLAALGRAGEADPYFANAIGHAEGGPDGNKQALYFLYIGRAQGLDKLDRRIEAEELRAKAAALLPRNNPGAQGFHV